MEESQTTPDFNQQKEQLYKSAKEIKKALDQEFDNLKENAGELSKLILISGTIFLVTYSLVSSFRSKRKKKKYQDEHYYPVPYQPQENSLIKTIKEQIALFLISIAQNKIKDFLDKTQTIGEHERGNT